MDDRKVPANGGESSAVSSAPKVWTAVRHSSALVGVLGLFVAGSAYSTDPNSGMVLAGLVITGIGIVGFLIGSLVSRWRRS